MPGKVIVFDVNGVLLKRVFKYDKPEMQEIIDKKVPIAHACDNRVYVHRNGLQKLVLFLNNNDVKYTFWSTMARHNLELTLEGLRNVGFKIPEFIFSVDDCDVGTERGDIRADKWVKDLRKVARVMKVNVEDCTLIDDKILKTIKGQNNFIVKEMEIRNMEDDDAIEAIIEYLKGFIASK